MMHFDLRIGQESDVGRVRQYNEDCAESFVPVDETQLREKGALFLVADGMGGHRAGGVASQTAIKHVIQEYYADEDPDVGDSLARAFAQANEVVFNLAQSDPDKAGMGTTLVAALILGHKVVVANVGDSRAYLLRRKRLTQITADHSWVEEQVRSGILTREQANRHPQRNLITRALGTRPAVDVDLFELDLQGEDVLLLCTDGLSGPVSDAKIAETIKSLPPPQAAVELIDEANSHGGRDNVTALIVRMGTNETERSLGQTLEGILHKQPRLRLVASLVALVAICACTLFAIYPVVDQPFVGNPAALPEPAQIRFVDVNDGNLAELANYLNYTDTLEMTAAHPGLVDAGTPATVSLWPSARGIFLVGQVDDMACEETCSFRLVMDGESYAVQFGRGAFEGDPPSLQGRRIRVYGQQSPVDQKVTARLMDLGERWWSWWKPAWSTIYEDHNWQDSVWVYSIVDYSPYSTLDMVDHPALQRGERIATKGKWLQGEPGDSMTFRSEQIYRLENGVYVPGPGESSQAPLPTVTLQVTMTP